MAAVDDSRADELDEASAAGVDVVLPVLDEAVALPWVLGSLPAGYRALVVDNGSTDGSGDIARRLGATVVVEPRRGFGAACAAGLAAASAPIVAFCDADASMDLRELPRVVGASRRVGAHGRPTPAWPIATWPAACDVTRVSPW